MKVSLCNRRYGDASLSFFAQNARHARCTGGKPGSTAGDFESWLVPHPKQVKIYLVTNFNLVCPSSPQNSCVTQEAHQIKALLRFGCFLWIIYLPYSNDISQI